MEGKDSVKSSQTITIFVLCGLFGSLANECLKISYFDFLSFGLGIGYLIELKLLGVVNKKEYLDAFIKFCILLPIAIELSYKYLLPILRKIIFK